MTHGLATATAALLVVVVGTALAYGWGPSSTLARTTGLLLIVAGTATLAGLLVRNLLGLRRVTRTHRHEATSYPVDEQLHRSAPMHMSAMSALRNGAASRRFADGADIADVEGHPRHRPMRSP